MGRFLLHRVRLFPNFYRESRTCCQSFSREMSPCALISYRKSMEGSRLSSVFRKPIHFYLQRFIRFSSSSAAKPAISESSCFFSGNKSNHEESLVYRNKLLFQSPTKIKCEKRLQNSVSLIGSVVYPVTTMKSSRLGVYTILRVKSSRDSDSTLRMFLMMWDKMAEISIKYLKENDLIYVSGYLDSYKKVYDCGTCRTCYQVTVRELNYVTCSRKSQIIEAEKTEAKEVRQPIPRASNLEKDVERLRLWQVFFANPYEWWDNRQLKTNPWTPDFKHKATGETLRLISSDPPWVRRQLQLHDSNMSGQLSCSRARLSEWKYD